MADRIYPEVDSAITPDRAIVKTHTHLDREISMLADRKLSHLEQQEAEGLVELAEFLSLLRLRSRRVMKQA